MNAATTALHPISTAQELMIYREGMYPTSVTENREPVRHPRPRRGTARNGPGDVPSHNSDDAGLVVISLGVDLGNHDQVHYQRGSESDSVGVLNRALEALTAARDALHRVEKV